MMDFGSMIGAIEKLNEYNYQEWRSCIKFYLKCQDLWEIVDGSDATQPRYEDKNYNSWIVKASKVMHILMCTVDKSLRTQIEDVETPKEAWDILASLFSSEIHDRFKLEEEKEWGISKENGELWIEDLESNDNFEISARSIIMEAMDDQPEDDVSIKAGDEGRVAVKEENGEFVFSQYEIQVVATQPDVRDWLGDPDVIINKDINEKFACQGAEKQGERLMSKRPPHQFKHAKFDIGANIKRPPDRENQLDTMGEY